MDKLTVTEAAKLKGCSRSRILQLIHANILPVEIVGPIYLIPKYAVEAYRMPGQGRGPRPRGRKKNAKAENNA